MDDLTQSNLTFDTFDMTQAEAAQRRSQLEADGWMFIREIPVRDTFKRVHIYLLFKRDVQDGEYPVEDVTPSSGFKEVKKPRYETRPRKSIAYYLVTVGLLFGLFVLFHPIEQGQGILQGAAVYLSSFSPMPSEVKPANSNTVRRVRRVKPKTRKIAESDPWQRAITLGGFFY